MCDAAGPDCVSPPPSPSWIPHEAAAFIKSKLETLSQQQRKSSGHLVPGSHTYRNMKYTGSYCVPTQTGVK